MFRSDPPTLPSIGGSLINPITSNALSAQITMTTETKKPELDIALTPVTSSNIESIGYDAATQRLAVKFKSSKKAYIYAGVSAETHDQLMGAASVGKFIGANIVGKFNHKTIEV